MSFERSSFREPVLDFEDAFGSAIGSERMGSERIFQPGSSHLQSGYLSVASSMESRASVGFEGAIEIIYDDSHEYDSVPNNTMSIDTIGYIGDGGKLSDNNSNGYGETLGSLGSVTSNDSHSKVKSPMSKLSLDLQSTLLLMEKEKQQHQNQAHVQAEGDHFNQLLSCSSTSDDDGIDVDEAEGVVNDCSGVLADWDPFFPADDISDGRHSKTPPPYPKEL